MIQATEFVGGPFCGYMWLPEQEMVYTAWPEERSMSGLDFNRVTPGLDHPASATFDPEPGLLWVWALDGDVFLYAQVSDHKWEHQPDVDLSLEV